MARNRAYRHGAQPRVSAWRATARIGMARNRAYLHGAQPRVSVQSRGGRVFLATWVHPHNWGGRLYLNAIMPFHVLIVRNALARVARQEHSLVR